MDLQAGKAFQMIIGIISGPHSIKGMQGWSES